MSIPFAVTRACDKYASLSCRRNQMGQGNQMGQAQYCSARKLHAKHPRRKFCFWLLLARYSRMATSSLLSLSS